MNHLDHVSRQTFAIESLYREECYSFGSNDLARKGRQTHVPREFVGIELVMDC